MEQTEGLFWYQTTNTFARGLAEKHGLSTLQACGIIAALSPQISWERNMIVAEAMCALEEFTGVYMANKDKAARIYGGENPLDVLGGKKVRAFFNCISEPETSNEVCIDRHAFDIAEAGFENTDDIRRLALNRVGVYESLAEAYRTAAVIVNLRPHQLQAVTWLTWRVLKKGAFSVRLPFAA